MAYAKIVFPWAEAETDQIVWHAARLIELGERKFRGGQLLVYKLNLCSLKALVVDTPDHSDVNTEATIDVPAHPSILKTRASTGTHKQHHLR